MVQNNVTNQSIKIYSDNKSFMWSNNETLLFVADRDGRLVADYDLCSGLKLMSEGDNITMYVDNDDMVSGNWTLLANKYSEDFPVEKIVVHGRNETGSSTRTFDSETPWKNCGSGFFVTRQEREQRLDLCKECPFFNTKDMTCDVDDNPVLKTTKEKDGLCPKNKWGDRQRINDEIEARGGITYENTVIDQTDQTAFEEELAIFLGESS